MATLTATVNVSDFTSGKSSGWYASRHLSQLSVRWGGGHPHRGLRNAAPL
jgi:hypothetical protein